jgi:hypothetical protein
VVKMAVDCHLRGPAVAATASIVAPAQPRWRNNFRAAAISRIWRLTRLKTVTRSRTVCARLPPRTPSGVGRGVSQ